MLYSLSVFKKYRNEGQKITIQMHARFYFHVQQPEGERTDHFHMFGASATFCMRIL